MARPKKGDSPPPKPNLIGGHFDDVLTGSSKGEFFHGKSGNDTIYALGGDDVISAGNDDDLIWGGTGNDTFIIAQGARSSHDTIFDWNVGDKIDVQRGGSWTVTQIGPDVQVALSGGPIIDILGVNITDVLIV